MAVLEGPKKAIKVFYSYAQEDEKLRKKLEKQLILLRRQEYITDWHDRMISPGTDRIKEIDNYLRAAQIILLLVSPDFIASDYCYSIEVDQAMKNHQSGGARVIPVILRPVNWHQTPFGKLQALPPDGKPITGRSWHNQDEAFFTIAEGIRKAVEELSAISPKAKDTSEQIVVKEFITDTDAISSASKEKESPVNVPIYTSRTFQKQNQTAKKILIIDDERNVIAATQLGLKYEGFHVEGAYDGEEGITKAQRISPDIIILDLGLPDMDGIEVCQRLHANPSTRDIPILMFTARVELEDRIFGLNAGADAYLSKPIEFDELVAHIRAILRRQQRIIPEGTIGSSPPDYILQFGDLVMNTAIREVTRGGRLIELTATEYNLLHLFMSHPREVLDRKTILNRVWGYDFLGETNIIEVYVRNLREKIEDYPTTPRLIQTVRSVGYVLKG
jgi:two-component system, OmpR family, response regulator MprA